MKTFSNYLTESKSAPLFHGTDLFNAISILKDNTMFAYSPDAGDAEDGHIRSRVISMSRLFRYSAEWNKAAIVFELDQQKLSHRYNIRPYNYFYHAPIDNDHRHRTRGPREDTESEEYIDRNITDLNKYIIKIHWMKDPGPQEQKQYKEPSNINDTVNMLNYVEGAEKYLLHHPKLFYRGHFVNI